MVELRNIINERFGKSTGGPKSDFDIMKEDMLNFIRCQDKMLVKVGEIEKRLAKIEKKVVEDGGRSEQRKSKVSLNSPKYGSTNLASDARARRLSLEPESTRSPRRTPSSRQLNGGQPITAAAAREKRKLGKLTAQEKAAGIVIFRYWRSYQQRKQKMRREAKQKRQRRGSASSVLSGNRRRRRQDDDFGSDCTGYSGEW